jgi:hypothetical protein
LVATQGDIDDYELGKALAHGLDIFALSLDLSLEELEVPLNAH